MKTRWQPLFQKRTAALRDRLELVLTIMARRHQRAVVECSGTRPHGSPADRCFWVLCSTVGARWITALAIVHTETVRRWTRQGVRHHLAWQRWRQRPGRPAIAAETRALIRHMSREHVLWGAPRLHGEWAMLGITVSRTTVATYMIRHPYPPSPTWRTCRRNHVPALMGREASAELLQRVRARSARLLMAFRGWLDRWVAGERERDAWDGRHGAVILFRPLCDTVSMPRLWTLGMQDRVAMAERSPPVSGWSSHGDLSVAEPTDVERADVRLASSSMGRVGKCAFIQRQMRAHLRGRKREDSRRAVA